MNTAKACGPYFDADFFVMGGRDCKKMPPAWFPYELYHLNGIKAAPKTAEDPQTKTCNLTIDTELAELEPVLRASGKTDAEMTEILDACKNLRCAMFEAKKAVYEYEASFRYWKELEPYRSEPSPPPNKPAPFDLTSHETLLSRLPEAFALYVRGAAAYQNQDYAQAQTFFEKVTTLPPADGLHRNLSATYMLGMCSFKLAQYDTAFTFFDKVQQLVANGEQDPFGFADSVVGLKARSHYVRGDFAAAAKYYLDMCATSDPKQQETAMRSLAWTFCKLNPEKHSEQLESIFSDEGLRKALVAWSLANPEDSSSVRAWLLPKWESLTGSVPYADRLAWLAYDAGDMEQAKRWAGVADPSSVITLWVRAKVLLHDGAMDEAIATLKQVVNALNEKQIQNHPESPEWKAYKTIDEEHGDYFPLDLTEQSKAELSALWVIKKPKSPEEYKQAFENLSWVEEACIAEQQMTTDDLCQYVRAYCHPAKGNETQDRLRDVLARRLVREGKIAESIEFFPERKNYASSTGPMTVSSPMGSVSVEIIREPDRESVRQLLKALKEGRDADLHPVERAKHLMEAARITREGGLYATEVYPDWSCDSSYSTFLYDQGYGNRSNKDTGASTCGRRFNYLFLAADLMWEAASLLPNNDPLTAEALYWGGYPIRNLDSKAADKFYKALVRRNPKLAIAKEADKRHWFPDEFKAE